MNRLLEIIISTIAYLSCVWCASSPFGLGSVLDKQEFDNI